MEWLTYVSYFFGGAFVGNAIPHLVSGVSGRAFQSPFAKPPGEGLSSARVNILWGYFNAGVGYLLIFKVGDFEIHQLGQVGAVGVGALVISLFCGQHFGKFHGGNLPNF